jgi:hypothetical protein
MNIWRERVPHQCESIRTWKEVLENRNFIYEQLCNFIQPHLNTQGDQQNRTAAEAPAMSNAVPSNTNVPPGGPQGA